MIALASQCLLLQRPDGQVHPAQAAAVAIEIVTDSGAPFDEAFVHEAAAAVLHFFRNEQQRESVTLGEFAGALEKVFSGFHFAPGCQQASGGGQVAEADLERLAADAGGAYELTFFPRLRDMVRSRSGRQLEVLRFHGLRNCVMRLIGARRWTARCQCLQEQIVAFLRECLGAEPLLRHCALVVE